MPSTHTKTQLPNGITVLLKEIHTTPLISLWVWYRVGSRDEVPPLTGISHLVEHMQFKGTRAFPAEVMDRAVPPPNLSHLPPIPSSSLSSPPSPRPSRPSPSLFSSQSPSSSP